jgi:hypothetical protein
VIATQAEIDMVRRTFSRRMMRLPVTRGDQGEMNLCPVRRGRTYQLQPRPSAKGEVSITVIDCRREKLAALSLADARREGHATIQDALVAFRSTHGHHEEVWVVTFARDKDDEVAALISEERPLYLASSVGLTFDRGRAAAGEPEVLMPFEKDLAKARKATLEQRIAPGRASVKNLARDTETLQQSIKNMKARQLLRRAQRNLEAADRLLLSEVELHSPVSAAVDGSRGEADRPPRGAPLASPEAA